MTSHAWQLLAAAILEALNGQYKQPTQALTADVDSARTLIKAKGAEGQQLWEHLAPGTGEPC